MKTISFVIPCYGSEKTVSTVIDGIKEKMQERQDYSYEIIAVNDCSPDNVISVLRAEAAKDKKVKVVDLAINVGKHGAVLAGYREVSGDYVVNIDDDGQCPIEGLWELLKPIEEGHDMSMAKYEKKKESFLKRVGSKANNKMSMMLLGKPKDMVFTNFIARQRYITDAMAEYKNVFPYLEGLSLRVTKDVVLVPMQEHSRLAGRSGYTLMKSLKLAMNGYTSFSGKPLKVSYIIGILFILAAIAGAIVSIINGNDWDKIVFMGIVLFSMFIFVSGIFMLVLGLIGDYLGRILIGINRYPQIVVKNKINL